MKEKRHQHSEILVGQPLKGKVALIIGGRSIDACLFAIFLAYHGVDVAVVCQKSHAGCARETKKLVEAAGRRCLTFTKANDAVLSKEIVRQTAQTLDGLDIFFDFSCQSKGEILPATGRRKTPGHHRQGQTGLWVSSDLCTAVLEQWL